MKALLVVLGVVVVLVGVLAGSYITNHNYGNRAETTIVFEHRNMENILSQYSLKVMEVAQVPAMYKDDLKEVMTEVMSARMGADGSKATFQWFKEHNINIDSAMYVKIQQVIESGRNKFENSQTKFLDTKKVYVTNLGTFYRGMWLRIVGYPKIDLDKYKIVTSEHSNESFATGIDKGLKLR